MILKFIVVEWFINEKSTQSEQIFNCVDENLIGFGLATGSKQGFKQSMLEPIKQFKIVAFPDKSE
jgi:hypothetical protein